MKIEKFETNERSSRVVVVDSLVFIGGTTAPAEVEGIADQTKFVLNKLEGLLEQYGSCKANLLSATIYLKSLDDYNGMNACWNEWLKDVVAPSRACVGAVLAGSHALVEISLIAAKK